MSTVKGLRKLALHWLGGGGGGGWVVVCWLLGRVTELRGEVIFPKTFCSVL